MSPQRTIQESQKCKGLGVRYGKLITLGIHPAPPDTGVVFIRTDLEGKPNIKANIASVVDTRNATTIGSSEATVSIVEHLLAAARGMGIDNLIVEVDGPEVPLMDGSAAPFIKIFRKARIVYQDRERTCIVIKKPVEFRDGDRMVRLEPLSKPRLRISYTIEYSDPFTLSQSHEVEFTNGTFMREIGPARTYGFVHEIDALMRMGLIRGGSMDNAVVIGDSGVLNPEGLRFNNECVRHKILDSIGDLSLLGKPVIGHLVAYKSGHSVNLQFLQKLLEDKDSWEIRPSSSRAPRIN